MSGRAAVDVIDTTGAGDSFIGAFLSRADVARIDRSGGGYIPFFPDFPNKSFLIMCCSPLSRTPLAHTPSSHSTQHNTQVHWPPTSAEGLPCIGKFRIGGREGGMD